MENVKETISDSDMQKLASYHIEMTDAGAKIYDNSYEACEYFETAMDYYNQGRYELGNSAIEQSNSKIKQHDYWVIVNNEYSAKVDALRSKIKS